MSRVRDIAAILGRSEASNPTNLKLLKPGDAANASGQAIVDITVDGGGNVNRELRGHVEPGQPVILRGDTTVEKVGQPYSPHQNTHLRIISDSDGAGNNLEPAYGADSYHPQIFYIGNGKFIWVAVQGTTGTGDLYARCFRLNTDGTAIDEAGPMLTVQSSYYSSSTSYGGTRADKWMACKGENNRIHVLGTYRYYSSYIRSLPYVWTFYPEDVDDVNNLTLLPGTTKVLNSSTSTSYYNLCDRPIVMYTTQAEAEKLYTVGTTRYGGHGLYVDQNSTWRQFSFSTAGNTINVNAGPDTLSSSTYGFNDYNYRSEPWLVRYPTGQGYWWVNVNHTNKLGNGLALFVNQMRPRINARGEVDVVSSQYQFTTETEQFGFGHYDGCFDSGAEHSIIVYRDHNNVGQIKTISHNSGYPTIRSGTTQFAAYVDNRPSVIHDKSQNKNLVMWDDPIENPTKIKMRWFTCDSVGVITLEDSTHDWNADSSFYGSYPPMMYKFDDYDTSIISDFRTWGAEKYGPLRTTSPENGLWVFKPERRQQSNLSSTGVNYLGIAQDSGDSGDIINIKIHGAIDTNQFGLIPNNTYYINEINGNLETNTNNGSVRAGIAASASTLKIITIPDSA